MKKKSQASDNEGKKQRFVIFINQADGICFNNIHIMSLQNRA